MKHLKIAALIAATTLSTLHADDNILGPISMQIQLMQSGQSPERTLEELGRLGRGQLSDVEQAALRVAMHRLDNPSALSTSIPSLTHAAAENNSELGALLESLSQHRERQTEITTLLPNLNFIISNQGASGAQRLGAMQEAGQLVQESLELATSSDQAIREFFENENLTDEQREEARTLIELVTGHRPE